MLKVCFLTFLFTSIHSTIWDDLTATVAVVEYQPIRQNSTENTLLINSLKYTLEIAAISSGTNKSADLIIFPEATLGNDPSTAVDIEINTSWKTIDFAVHPIISTFSYAADQYNTYLVVNLVERSKCQAIDKSKNCKNTGYRYYNSDVIFDRNGTILNVYRKYNLFGENDLDKTENPELIIFYTDFGIKFGIFTCFDILFKSPAQDLLTKENIDAVVFPTMWFSELPFLTAIQTQHMWAYGHNITVFAAGANNPKLGSGGTGVYRGEDGAILSEIMATGGSKALIYESVNGNVKPQPAENVDQLAKDMDRFFLLRDPSINDYKFQVLNTSLSDFKTQLCYENGTNNLCCNFELKMDKKQQEKNNVYTYHLVAFSGVRTFSGVYNGGIDICAIIACLNTSLSSCGQRFNNYDEVDWTVSFKELTITADFDKNENKTQFPNSLLSSIRPIDSKKTLWTSEEVNGIIRKKFSIKEEQNRILTFGIYGRDFNKDFPPNDDDDDNNNNDDDDSGNNSNVISICPWLLFLCTFILLNK